MKKPAPKIDLEGGDKKPDWRSNFWPFLIMLVMLWLWQAAMSQLMVRTIPYSEFRAHLARHEVVDAVVKQTEILGHIAPKSVSTNMTASTPAVTQTNVHAAGANAPATDGTPFAFRTQRIEDPDLVRDLQASGAQYNGERPSFLSQFLVSWILPMAIYLGIWSLVSRKMGVQGQSIFGFGKSTAKLVEGEKTGVGFADVAGCEEAKLELKEVVDFLKNPKHYTEIGAKIPKGVLLIGPPGTGKTLLARAVAGEAKVPFFSITGSDFVEVFVGVGAARVRDLFEQAKKHAPCIIFIDELDAIGQKRSVYMGSVNDEREQTLNQLLAEMDGFDPNQGVIIMAATNRPEILDAALLRPGRFDRQILVDRPDIKGRTKILQLHAQKVKLSPDLDLAIVAAKTPGFVGADLANIVNEAALLAARQDKESIEMAEFDEAIERVVAGLQKKSHVINPKEKNIVAHHESGHALVAELVPGADPVAKISIIPRGIAALGYTTQLPTEDRYLMTRSELLARICVLLGGRAAEEIIFGDMSTGAQNDLQRATEIARTMITQYGMSEKLGLASREGPRTATFLMVPTHSPKEYSEETARLIDEEVKLILTEAHTRARDLLISRRAALEELAKLLLEKEVVDRPALQAILKVRSIDSIKEKKKSANTHGSENNEGNDEQEQPKA